MVSKVWGGERLGRVFGKEGAEGLSLGEAWEVADLAEGQSRVGSGPLKGEELRALSKRWGRALVGERAECEERFPLLVKLLDAKRDLSVQVHPGHEDLPFLEGAESKDECWLILDVEPGGAIIHGLNQDGVSVEDFRRALDAGLVEELMEKVEVSPGDLIHVPPGTIHAICAGVALLEIQEPSDTTYRVYDYHRLGLDGQLRPLHVEEALEVSRLGRSRKIIVEPEKGEGALKVLLETESYRIEELALERGARFQWGVDPDSPQIIHLLEGMLELEDGIGGEVVLKPYETAVVPAVHGAVKGLCRGRARFIVSGLAVPGLVRGLTLRTLSPETAG